MLNFTASLKIILNLLKQELHKKLSNIVPNIKFKYFLHTNFQKNNYQHKVFSKRYIKELLKSDILK